jgi:hypothetical protein
MVPTFKLQNFKPPENKKVNLFKNVKFFKDYEEVYGEIIQVNEETRTFYKDYKGLVDYVRR